MHVVHTFLEHLVSFTNLDACECDIQNEVQLNHFRCIVAVKLSLLLPSISVGIVSYKFHIIIIVSVSFQR